MHDDIPARPQPWLHLAIVLLFCNLWNSDLWEKCERGHGRLDRWDYFRHNGMDKLLNYQSHAPALDTREPPLCIGAAVWVSPDMISGQWAALTINGGYYQIYGLATIFQYFH